MAQFQIIILAITILSTLATKELENEKIDAGKFFLLTSKHKNNYDTTKEIYVLLKGFLIIYMHGNWKLLGANVWPPFSYKSLLYSSKSNRHLNICYGRNSLTFKPLNMLKYMFKNRSRK